MGLLTLELVSLRDVKGKYFLLSRREFLKSRPGSGPVDRREIPEVLAGPALHRDMAHPSFKG